jgi:cell division protein FtsB
VTSAASRRTRSRAFWDAHWPRLVLSIGLLAVFFGNQGFRSLVRNYLELRSLKREIASLETEQRRQEYRLKVLRSGDGSVEHMARRELGYIRKGEIEYRFPPPQPE